MCSNISNFSKFVVIFRHPHSIFRHFIIFLPLFSTKIGNICFSLLNTLSTFFWNIFQTLKKNTIMFYRYNTVIKPFKLSWSSFNLIVLYVTFCVLIKFRVQKTAEEKTLENVRVMCVIIKLIAQINIHIKIN